MNVLLMSYVADTMFFVHPLVVFSVHWQSAVPSIPPTASTSSSIRRAFSSNLIIEFLVSGAWWLSVNWLCHHHQWLCHPLHHPFIIIAERVTNASYQTTTNWLNYLLSSFCFLVCIYSLANVMKTALNETLSCIWNISVTCVRNFAIDRSTHFVICAMPM